MITGATAGFGKAIAVRFAGNGYNLIITGRRKISWRSWKRNFNHTGILKYYL